VSAARVEDRPRARGLAWRSELRPWAWAVVAAGAAFGLIFLAYFLVYRSRHFALPLGWDTPWYVWRADFVASEGLGPLGTNARPGHSLLSAVLGAVTGRSQLELQVVVPFVLVGVFALAVGALVSEGLGREPGRWLVAVGVAGAVVGGTRLVGENVANLLHVLLVVAGLVFVVRLVGLGRGFAGSVSLLVAAGLAHWLFLGVTGAALFAWFLLALVRLGRERAAGVPLLDTEAGRLGGVGLAVGGAMAALIYPVLGSSLSTFEIHEAERRFLPKLREDLSNLAAWAVGPLAAVGLAVAAVEERSAGLGPATSPARRAFLRLLLAWTVVCLAGLAYAALTLDLPPHRFLTLLVAVSVIVGAATALHAAARALARRGGTAGRAGAVALAAVTVAALAVPGLGIWYGPADLVDGAVVNAPAEGPEQWFDVAAFEQARAAAAYVQTLPPGTPVVFAVGPTGASGPISVPLKERTIRAALPPDRQVDAHVYPGEPGNLLDGRPTRTGLPEFDEANLPYWEDVRALLREVPTPPVVVIEALGPREHREALVELDGVEIAPGTALLNARPPGDLEPPPPVSPVPSTEVGLVWAVLIVAALSLSGSGWTAWFLGPGAGSLTIVSLAPAVGTGMLILGGLVAAEAAGRLGGGVGIGTFLVTAALGWALALASARRRRRG
jgi:hypothetical protein